MVITVGDIFKKDDITVKVLEIYVVDGKANLGVRFYPSEDLDSVPCSWIDSFEKLDPEGKHSELYQEEAKMTVKQVADLNVFLNSVMSRFSESSSEDW